MDDEGNREGGDEAGGDREGAEGERGECVVMVVVGEKDARIAISGYPTETTQRNRAAVAFAHCAVGPAAVGSRNGVMAFSEAKL